MSESETESTGSISSSWCSNHRTEDLNTDENDVEDGENDDDDECDDDDDDENEIDAMAVALSPSQGPIVNPFRFDSGMSIIKRADQCTVYERSHVVNTYQQMSPDLHNHFIGQGNDFLRTKVKQLKPVYVESRGARECAYILESENSLVIVGNPGEGKTTAAIMTMDKLAKTGYQPIIITSPKEWNSKVVQAEKTEKLVIFIDDMFGTVGVDENKVNEWIAMNEVISQLLEKRTGSFKIICTVRRKVYKAVKQRIKRFRWFKSFRMVDISDKTYALSESEKTELLQKYFKHYKVPKGRQCLIAAKADPPHGFAHCVELYCTEPHCLRMGISFFMSPLSAVEREIQILYETLSTQYYALLLIHLSPGQKVTVDIMSGEEELDQTLLNKARLLSKLPTRDGMDIIRAIEKMTDNYLREEDDGSVGFRHDTVSEMVGVIATRNSPIPAVNYLSLQFLSEKTKYVAYKEDDKDEVAILPKKCTLKLVKRITEALFNGEAFAACKHHAWENVNFVYAWLDHVKKNKSDKHEGNTLLDDVLTMSLEIYQVMQRNSNSGPEEVHVGLMFLLYLNKKEMAREEIMNFYQKQTLEESERLIKFRQEQRCPSGRKLKRVYSQEEELENTAIN
ncbi:uncharacterized protein LOC123564766 [Mercenaria mercenaria]|uniref:uncharacterized protein LOC123564766 n=1 Tax=Mercenaria mercenaria TaxID=6596 RepID=UPI00234E8C32|nr:uncharacterized protein LOC123564766 [Mercenaria mercenaria]